MVFAAEGGLEDLDEEDLKDLFSDDIANDHGSGVQAADAEIRNPEAAGSDEAEDGDQRGAAHRVLPDPGEPTAAQVEDHRACGHLPFRSWCQECVEARGVG